MTYTYSKLPLPPLAPGCEHQLAMHTFAGNGSKRSAYIQAGLHADEHPGLLVIWHLLELLQRVQQQNKLFGTVVIVPVANPIGLSQNVFGNLAGRFDLHNGENFNRNFPAVDEELRASLQAVPVVAGDTELLKQRLQNALSAHSVPSPTAAAKKMLLQEAFKHDIVLDLHCDTNSVLHVYGAKDQRQRALRLGKHINARAVLLETEAGGQPFDESYAKPWRTLRSLGLVTEDAQGFSTTVELRGQGDVNDGLARNDALGILKFLESEGLLECIEDPIPMPDSTSSEHSLESVHHQLATCTGLLVYKAKPGDQVLQGEVIGDILELGADIGVPRHPIVAELDGLVIAIRNGAMVRAGERVALIAGASDLPHRKSGQLLKNF